MSLTPSLQRKAVEALASRQCACGGFKERKHAFCIRCYAALPLEVKRKLWRTFSEGFAEAYDEAVDWLRVHTDRLTQGGLRFVDPEIQ